MSQSRSKNRRQLDETPSDASLSPSPAAGDEGWSGPFYEDLVPGSLRRSHLGRTITEADNLLFTHLSLNINQLHFNARYAEDTPFGRPVANSLLTLAVITGLATPDTSLNAFCNLGWSDIRLLKPVYVGDTLWSETEILEKRESASNPDVGIVTVRSRGLNQDGQVVLEFRRTFMAYKRTAARRPRFFPAASDPWGV